VTLTPEHRQFLLDCAFTEPMMDGVESYEGGIAFDLVSPTGRVLRQIRPDEPRLNAQGKPVKYETPAGERLVLPVPPGMQDRVMNQATKLLIVEGTKGHRAAAGYAPNDLAVVGVLGCWGWKRDDRPNPDLFAIPLEQRDVVVALDADISSNASVYDAANGLQEALLMTCGAGSVTFVKVPGGGDDSIDDFLAMVPEAARQRRLQGLVNAAQPLQRLVPKRPRDNRFIAASGRVEVEDMFHELERRHRMAVTLDDTIAVFKHGRYANGRSREFGRSVLDILGNHYRPAHEDTILKYSLNRLKTEHRVIPDRPGVPLVNVANGLLNLDTLELEPHASDYMSLVQFPIEWDEDATAPAYEDWLAGALQGGDEQIAAIEETFAQMLDPEAVPTKAAFLFGPSRSGKSTYLTLAADIAGKSNMSAVSLHDLSGNGFAAAEVYGKILNVCADLSSAHVRDTSLFKQLLGEDVVHANKKYGDQFTFRNNAMFAFSANEIPTVGEGSGAYLARMRPFLFPHSRLGSEDLTLRARLRSEQAGIFRRWVTALRAHRARNGFLPVDQGVAVEFETSSDAIRAFIAERTVPDAMGTQAAILYAEYELWCQRTGRRALSATRFGERLKDADIARREKRRDGNYYLVRIVAAGSIDLTDPTPPRGAGTSQTPGTESDNVREEWHTPSSVVGVEGGGDNKLSDTSNSPQSLTHTTHNAFNPPHAPQPSTHPPHTPVVFDLETTGLDGLHTDPRGFVRIVAVEDTGGQVEVVSPEIGDKVLGDLLADGHQLVAHNGMQFDFLAMQRRGVLDVLAHGDAGYLIDSKVLALLNDPPAAGMKTPRKYYGLDSTAQRLAGVGKSHDLGELADKHGGFDAIPVDDEEYLAYAAQDVSATRAMFEHLDLSDYARREMRVMARLSASITGVGFRVDEPLMAHRILKGREHRAERIEWLVQHTGLPLVNDKGEPYKSPHATKPGKQALVSAFEALGITLPTTDKGRPSMSSDTMSELIEAVDHDGPVAELAYAIQQLQGVRTVYETVAGSMHADGRVHPEVNAFQASGRLSVQNPGLTVMGKRGGKHVEREVFLPDSDDEVLVAFDLNQIDARAIAMHSQDPGYMALFCDPSIDSHTEIARSVFGDVKRRDEAKVIGHSWNYGAGPRSIAARAGLPESTVYEFDRAMRAQFPRLVTWRDEVRERAATGALMDNGFGRLMRPEPDRAWTQGPALMGQGLARDLLMEGLLRLPLDAVARLRAVVHDEVVFSVPRDAVEEFKAVVLEAMQFEFMGVPVTAGFEGQGDNWGAIYEKRK